MSEYITTTAARRVGSGYGYSFATDGLGASGSLFDYKGLARQIAASTPSAMVLVTMGIDGKNAIGIPVNDIDTLADMYSAATESPQHAYIAMFRGDKSEPVDEALQVGVATRITSFSEMKYPLLIGLAGLAVGAVFFYQRQRAKGRAAPKTKPRGKRANKRYRPSWRRRTITTWF